MGFMERLQRKITLRQYELNFALIATMLATLLLITNWPRFMSDAMEVPWYGYVVLIAIFLLPLLKRWKGK